MANAVSPRLVATDPASTAATSPPAAPTSGSSGAGIGQPLPAARIRCMAAKPPKPRKTAWPKSSMPPCPSSMLNDSANTMAMPMRQSSDRPNPLDSRYGAAAPRSRPPATAGQRAGPAGPAQRQAGAVTLMPSGTRPGPWAGTPASAPAADRARSARPGRWSGSTNRSGAPPGRSSGRARQRRQSGRSRLIDTVWIIPMSTEATNAPQIDPRPPITTTANTMAPSEAAMPGCVVNALPAITPARPANAQPAPNTRVNTRGTSWPSMDTMSGWVSAARTTRPSRVRDRAANSATNMPARPPS